MGVYLLTMIPFTVDKIDRKDRWEICFSRTTSESRQMVQGGSDLLIEGTFEGVNWRVFRAKYGMVAGVPGHK